MNLPRPFSSILFGAFALTFAFTFEFSSAPPAAAADDLPKSVASIDVAGLGAQYRVTTKDFHGFELLEMTTLESPILNYKIARPKQAAAGMPWVWRSRFWGHRWEFDRAMLAQGWHIVYCDVSNLYGADSAVQRWNQAYGLTQRLGLSKTPVIEAMSRGGLIAMRWALANPHQVAGIYLDNAVLDIRSWPGGKQPGGLTTGQGSKGDWAKCLKAYGLDEKSVAEYQDGPLEHLDVLVKADVPIYALINGADSVVPPAENGDLLATRYKQLGGRIIAHRRPGLNHHPHGLDDPAPIVDFAKQAVLNTSRQ